MTPSDLSFGNASSFDQICNAELAASMRQDAATCNFKSSKDPQDEAMRTRFICSLGKEAVLKALFKMSDEKMDLSKAVDVAVETEDAAKVANEAVHGWKTSATPVLKMGQKKGSSGQNRASKI